MNNPAFARKRENMSEFGGCGVAVRAIRRGFSNLLLIKPIPISPVV